MKLNNFGPRLKEIRLQRKLSQTEMGQLLGIHYIHIGRYEAGKAVPSVETLLSISQILNINLDRLVFGEQAKSHLGDEELLYLMRQLLTLAPEDRIEAKKLIGSFIAERKMKAQDTSLGIDHPGHSG